MKAYTCGIHHIQTYEIWEVIKNLLLNAQYVFTLMVSSRSTWGTEGSHHFPTVLNLLLTYVYLPPMTPLVLATIFFHIAAHVVSVCHCHTLCQWQRSLFVLHWFHGSAHTCVSAKAICGRRILHVCIYCTIMRGKAVQENVHFKAGCTGLTIGRANPITENQIRILLYCLI